MNDPTGFVPKLQLLGKPHLCIKPGGRVALAPKDALMLALLALEGMQPRERLAQLLWPGAPAPARNNLRQRLKRLQDACGQPLFDPGTKDVALAPGVAHDLGADAAATESHGADFGPVATLLGTLSFDEGSDAQKWLTRARDRIKMQLWQADLERAQVLLQSGQPAAALPAARSLVTEHPDNEAYVRLLMGVLHALGEFNAALAAYDKLRRLLARSRGESPCALTRELVQQIRQDAQPDAAAPTTPDTWRLLLRPPQLIERNAEWALLEAVWLRGGIALVEGIAGIGKSRLLADFTQAKKVPLRVHAHHGDAHVPYALVARAVEALANPADAVPAWARRELAHLSPRWGEPAPGSLAPVRLVRAIQTLAKGVTSVWVDDLQFADTASLELLPVVLQPIHCVLISARLEERPAGLQAWLQQAGEQVIRIPLQPWSQAAVMQLLETVDTPCAPEPQWAALLWRHSGGHPLLLLETMRALTFDGSGNVKQQAQRAPAALPIPPHALQLVQHRLSKLSADALGLARLAAIASPDFDASLALAAGAYEPAALTRAWEELQSAALLGPQAMLHDVVLQAVLAEINVPTAQLLHAAVAAQLQLRQVAPARIAPIWAKAGKPEEAALAFELAAKAALKFSRLDEAVRHFDEASGQWVLAHRAEAAFMARREGLEALIRAGQVSESLAGLTALAPHASGNRCLALLHRSWALAMAFAGDLHKCQSHARRAAELAQSLGDTQLEAEAVVLLADSAAKLGQNSEAEAAIQREAQLPLSPGDWEHAITRHTTIATTLWKLGHWKESIERTVQGAQVSDREEARPEHLICLNNLASMHLQLGQPHTATELSHRVLALAEHTCGIAGEHSVAVLSADMHLGIASARSGFFDLALVHLECAVDRARKGSMTVWQHVAESHLATAWMTLGQCAKALKLLDASTEAPNHSLLVRRAVIRLELRQLTGTTSPQLAACPALTADVDPVTRASAELAWAREMPPAARGPELVALAHRMRASGLHAHAMQARVLALETMGQRLRLKRVDAALELLSTLATTVPTGYPPEAYLIIAQTLRSAARPKEAQAAFNQGWEWIERAAQHHVAAHFIDAFWQRNAVNRQYRAEHQRDFRSG